jgi:hypothetical protein
MTAFSGR